MKKWVLKAIIQKAISFLPYKHQINYLFQKYVTKGVYLSDLYFEDKLKHFNFHQSAYLNHHQELNGIKVFELGTGWYPVIPLCFFLNNAEKITTVDIAELTSKEKLKVTIQKLLDYHQTNKLAHFIPYQLERIEQLQTLLKQEALDFNQLLSQVGMDYQIGDATKLSLASHYYDLLVSNNTFEHVFPDALRTLLLKFKEITAPHGIMSHFIDMSDHFAHLDSRITIYNFLRFTSAQWRWIDNSIQPQNRWRITHYRALYKTLDIPITQEENRPGSVEELKTITLAEAFQDIREKDLAVSHSYVVSQIKK